MSKKTLAKKTTARKSATVAQQRLRLAAAIAEILANPSTPVTLYNDVAENIVGWQDAHVAEHEGDPAYIHGCLMAYEREEAKRKGGAS